MERLVHDVRFAARQLRRQPGFTLVAVLVMALGIGASAAIFGVVDHILLRPLDLPDSERLVTLCETHESMGEHCSVSPVNAADWADQARTLTAIGVARGDSKSWRDGETARAVAGGIATPGYFRTLGVRPVLGRLPSEEDVLPAGAGQVALVTHAFWQGELGGEDGVVGRTLVLDEAPYTVVGVLPPGFEAPRLEWIQLWTPLPFDPRDEANRDWRGFTAIGRLADGASPDDAQRELAAIQAELAERHPGALRGWGARAVRTRSFLVGDVRPVLTLFLAAVVMVLLVVAVNLASLLLSRATGRERELAIRAALGAGRSTLARQLLVEAGLLGALGGAVGVVLASWATTLFVRLAPPGIPRMDEVAMDGRVLAFAVAMTLATSVLFGLAPASRAWSQRHTLVLRAGRAGRGRGGDRLRRGLVAVEIALALTLVFGAGLLLRSFSSLHQWEPGFPVERLLTFQLFVSDGTYPEREQLRQLYDRATARLAALPGVEAVGTASAGPLFGGGDGRTPFLRPGEPDASVEEAPTVAWYDAGPGFFPTLGLPVLAGQGLPATAPPDGPVPALVNQTMARRHWPGRSPVGVRVRLPRLGMEAEIVGVVPDVPPFRPDEAAPPEIYLSNRRHTRWATFFVLRTAGDPELLAEPVRAVFAELDPDLAPSRLRALDDYVAGQLVRPRFNALLVTVLAVLALLLGAAGVYGVVAHAVALRTHEIGVRMAVGAARMDVVRWVLADGARLIGLGVGVGLAGAGLFARLLAGLLYGVSPADPWVLAGTALLFAAAALGATVIPAARAARVDPARTLRAD